MTNGEGCLEEQWTRPRETEFSPNTTTAAHWSCSLLKLGFVHANTEARRSSTISYIQAEAPHLKTIKDPSMEAWQLLDFNCLVSNSQKTVSSLWARTSSGMGSLWDMFNRHILQSHRRARAGAGLGKAVAAVILSLCAEELTPLYIQAAPLLSLQQTSLTLSCPITLTVSPQNRANYTMTRAPSCQDGV